MFAVVNTSLYHLGVLYKVWNVSVLLCLGAGNRWGKKGKRRSRHDGTELRVVFFFTLTPRTDASDVIAFGCELAKTNLRRKATVYPGSKTPAVFSHVRRYDELENFPLRFLCLPTTRARDDAPLLRSSVTTHRGKEDRPQHHYALNITACSGADYQDTSERTSGGV